jgi:FkbM family methyltransferase|tara:strand:- start:115 stop:750 length:636 start_codon:yes stop_codon:yes gene_type:complete
MEDEIELRGSWWWPIYDTACYKYLNRERYVPKQTAEFCKKHKVIVQAGGNCGMYPKLYSDIFDTVYTFEPDPLNFYCLTKNTGSNVIKFQACLGNERKLVNLSYERHKVLAKRPNAGGFWISGSGNFPILRIDDLGLKECDLIHLDIEGYEGEAILGGEETIRKFKPTISIELRGHGTQFSWPDNKIVSLLNKFGYAEVAKISHDRIFQCT